MNYTVLNDVSSHLSIWRPPCPSVCLPACAFFNGRMANKPATAELMKKQYCRSDFKRCARYMVFEKLGGDSVPSHLFPNNVERAREIIAAG